MLKIKLVGTCSAFQAAVEGEKATAKKTWWVNLDEICPKRGFLFLYRHLQTPIYPRVNLIIHQLVTCLVSELPILCFINHILLGLSISFCSNELDIDRYVL